MSMLDKIASAVTPMESDEQRREARERARTAARPGSWLSMIVDQHQQIENAFERARSAQDPAAQTAALKQLMLVLNGHSLAEEAVIYPGLVMAGEKAHSGTAYTQHTATKIQLGELETLPPLSQEFTEKLEHVRGAVLHHIYEEESNWLLDLESKASATENQRLTQRFTEEFERYAGGDALDGLSSTALGGRTATSSGLQPSLQS